MFSLKIAFRNVYFENVSVPGQNSDISMHPLIQCNFIEDSNEWHIIPRRPTCGVQTSGGSQPRIFWTGHQTQDPAYMILTQLVHNIRQHWKESTSLLDESCLYWKGWNYLLFIYLKQHKMTLQQIHCILKLLLCSNVPSLIYRIYPLHNNNSVLHDSPARALLWWPGRPEPTVLIGPCRPATGRATRGCTSTGWRYTRTLKGTGSRCISILILTPGQIFFWGFWGFSLRCITCSWRNALKTIR